MPKGWKTGVKKNEKTEPEQKRNDNFQTKKMMIKMKKNEKKIKKKKHDFQSLAGWDEHNTIVAIMITIIIIVIIVTIIVTTGWGPQDS